MSIAVQFSAYGTSEVLRAVDVAPLTAGPGQVRLAVRAAGVNPVDWKIMQGLMRQQIPLHLPAGLGSDVAGVVDQVGAGVTAFALGDEVLGTSLTPSYAESAIADPAALVTKPTKVPWEVAASLDGPRPPRHRQGRDPAHPCRRRWGRHLCRPAGSRPRRAGDRHRRRAQPRTPALHRSRTGHLRRGARRPGAGNRSAGRRRRARRLRPRRDPGLEIG